jgi:histidinol-phosphate aminotransferase
MSANYEKPPGRREGLRLHLNENTAGCSPAVLEVLRGMTRLDAAIYPDYEAAQTSAAAYFGVPSDFVQLTNGLDEGILAAVAAAFRTRDTLVPEALGVSPSFDMYQVCTEALGGRMVTVPLDANFTLPADRLRGARSQATRIVFVTNPHNPSGRPVPLDTVRALAAETAPALLFVDEAYADFLGNTLIDEATLRALPNVIVGRTFAKAFGIAGLRVGAVVAAPETLAPLRRVIPPYSVNASAAAALPVAIADTEYRSWYLAQAAESRALMTAACSRLGLTTWPSAANFMLVRIGDRAPAIATALAARNIFVRDRSSEEGCRGCIRVTTGIVEHTRQLIAALEEALCDEPR